MEMWQIGVSIALAAAVILHAVELTDIWLLKKKVNDCDDGGHGAEKPEDGDDDRADR